MHASIKAAIAAGSLGLFLHCGPSLDAPLWEGARFSGRDRDAAVDRGFSFIAAMASDAKTFSDLGADMLWCFYTISNTSKSPHLRSVARALGHDRALQWRRDHPAVPENGPMSLTTFVYGTDAADRLGVPASAIRDRVREVAARYSAVDFLDFDPTREPPPENVPAECSRCGKRNARGATICAACRSKLRFQSAYEIWLDALIATYSGDIYGVKLGASYRDTIRWLPQMRDYTARAGRSDGDFFDVSYAVSHVVYTLNDYGERRVSRSWLAPEFEFLHANLPRSIRAADAELTGEFLDSLQAFGVGFDNSAFRSGVEYLLTHQNADGSWGSSSDSYTRYHTTWTAIDGLREHDYRGERKSID